jgi:hypothetical protein
MAMNSRNIENVSFTGATATEGPFTLQGGQYMLAAVFASPSGLVFTLSVLAPDGSTYLSVGSAGVFSHANGVATIWLPPGTYEFVKSGSAGGGESASLSVTSIPSQS